MALSRIWSAFIIVAISVGLFQYFSGDKNIFSRMVSGRSDEAYDVVYYQMIGSPESAGYTSKNAFGEFLGGYGYKPGDSAQPAGVLITDNLANDSVRVLKTANPQLKVFTYRTIQSQLVKKADGIIETCKSAV